MCRSAAQRSEAQFGAVQVQFTCGAGSGSGSVQTTPAQPSPGAAERLGDGRRGRGGRWEVIRRTGM